jgi:hypothetical protein
MDPSEANPSIKSCGSTNFSPEPLRFWRVLQLCHNLAYYLYRFAGKFFRKCLSSPWTCSFKRFSPEVIWGV